MLIRLFTVIVKNINDKPCNIRLTNSKIDENLPAGTVVGGLSATDEDAGDTYSFAIVSGGNNFEISGTNLISKASFDHEQTPQLTVGIKVTDNHGASSSENLNITIGDVNEPPTGISLENGFDENVLPQNNSTKILAEDPDVNDTHIFSLVAGEGDTDNALFTVVNGNQLKPTIQFNYEEKSFFLIRLKVTDKVNNIFVSPVLVKINDVNEPPDSIYMDTPQVEAGLDPGTEVGRLFTVDPDNDAGDNHNYYETSQTYDVQVDLTGKVIARKTFVYNAADTTKNIIVFNVRSVDSGSLYKEQQIAFHVIKPIDREPPQMISNSLAFYEYYPDTVSQKSMDIKVGDNEGIDTVILHYKGIGQTEWSPPKRFEFEGSSGHQLNLQNYSTSISPAMFDEMGMMYWIEIKDVNKNIDQTDTSYIYRIRFNQSLKTLEGAQFNGTTSTYKIISLPVDLVSNVRDVLEDPDNLGPWNPDVWRLLQWNPNNQKYDEYPKAFSNLSQGQGYWFNTSKSPVSVNLGTVKTPKNTPNNPYRITLSKQWNEIGNPYPFDISWNDVVAANGLTGQAGKVYLFEKGAFKVGMTIPAYGGGFVFSEDTQSIKIPLIDANPTNGARIAGSDSDNQIDSDNWQVDLQLTSGNLQYNLGGFGMRQDASDSEDKYDEMLLPHFGAVFDYFFPHEEYFYPFFSRDVVTTSNNHIWTFTINQENNSSETVIHWDNSHFGNSSSHLVLYDMTTGIATDMNTENSYRFLPKQENNFKVIYGDDSFIRMTLENIRIAFGAPYPNPFNGQLTFPVNLPASNMMYKARLKIFNMMGQRIFNLNSDNLGAGSEQIVWKGRDQTGHETSKGIYLYELTVINGKQTYMQQGRILKE